MISRDVRIACKSGFHARPAKQFAMEAQKYDAEINVSYKNRTANGKSIIGLLQLGVSPGETISITAHGVEERQVLLALTKLLNDLNNMDGGTDGDDSE
ncbi:HPr family phosphocarrier protein [Paenibacillus chitinolyticus]